MSQCVETKLIEEPADFPAKDLRIGEIGIITHTVGFTQPGQPIIRGHNEFVFPSTKGYASLNSGYRARRLRDGGSVTFTNKPAV